MNSVRSRTKGINQAKKVKLLILDVDGVMTEGRILYSDRGKEIKAFYIGDGLGIRLLQSAGIGVAIISARESEAVTRRAEELGITQVYQGASRKIEVYRDILKNNQLRDEEVAYVGDDLLDLPLLKRAGFSVAVADSAPEVKKIVDYVTRKKGGQGAVREVCELIIKAQGKWKEVIRKLTED